jgi:G3E family GTPase
MSLHEAHASFFMVAMSQIAVIVNDMAQVNMDASLLRDADALRAAEPRLVELTNGCICCTLRADLIEVRRKHMLSVARN